MRKIAESTVRRLSLYLRFLEEFEEQGATTVSSEALASRGGTTSAQVRKDLSFFGSFGKRGLGYQVPALKTQLRDILGLDRRYRVIVIGAGVGIELSGSPIGFALTLGAAACWAFYTAFGARVLRRERTRRRRHTLAR